MQKIIKILFLLIFVLFSIIFMLKINPNNYELGQDSAVFLYTANEMIEGGAPYIDSWDHKGPFIYFLNELAILIHPSTLWGLFYLLTFLLASSILFLFWILSKDIPLTAISAGFLIFLLTENKVLYGNRTELFTSFFLMISIALFLIGKKKKKPLPFGFIGVLFAIVFLMRPNNTIYWVVLLISLLIECFQNKKITKNIIFFTFGAIVPIAVSLIYLVQKKALSDFFEQFFHYNFFYSSGTHNPFLMGISLCNNLTNSFGIPLLIIIFSGFILSAFLLEEIKVDTIDNSEIFSCYKILAISFPIELLFSSLSGRENPYYLGILPVYFMMIIIFVINYLIGKWRKHLHIGIFSSSVMLFCFILLFGATTQNQLNIIKDNWSKIYNLSFFKQTYISPETKFIIENSDQNDTILVWGAAAQYYVTSGRKSPTRYTYMFPLTQCDFVTKEMWQEFVSGVKERKPKLILETSNYGLPTGEKPYYIGCEHVEDSIEEFLTYISENYELKSLESPHIKTVYSLIE
ncbi:hypothetical protein [Flexilinea flocculi]|nr:hypothetical protein [Flexilinea flocculi]